MALKTEKRIQFHSMTNKVLLSHRTLLKKFIYILIKSEKHTVEHINYIFCNDEYLLGLNQHYLNRNTLTDIITFQLSPPDEPILADIYISVERIRANAKEYSSSVSQELLRVIFHGALHLCGYKDKSRQDIKQMRFKENLYLSNYMFHVKQMTSKS